jgi:amino acid adenylation domain-containing protein
MSTEIIEGFRLSPQQEHLWLLQQEGGGASYRAQCAISIEGKLDTNRLRNALGDVVQRHEILRTTFKYLPEMTVPLQVIDDGEIDGIDWSEADLSVWEDAEKVARTEEIFRQSGKRAFDFEQGKLLQASLLKLNAKSHQLILSMPSLSMDSTGLKNLVAEIGRAYTGDQASVDELLQYADISELLNEMLETSDTALGREFWRKQDVISVNMPALALERAITEEAGFDPDVVSVALEAPHAKSAMHLAQELETTPEILFLTCWYALLERHLKQEEIVVGTEFSLRKFGPLEDALGLFAKHLPLRRRVSAQMRFVDFLAQVKEMASDAYKWQESFSWERLGNGTRAHYAPYAFAFNTQPPSYQASDLSFALIRQFVCHDRFTLKLCGVRKADSIVIELHYDASLFGAADARRLALQFKQLLVNVLERPESALEDFDILSDDERRQVLYEFNDTQVDFGRANLIHELVEIQAERTPNAVAIVTASQQLTYGELNEQANHLAHFLRNAGSVTLVGVCAERSPEMIVGLLGILKAGGAYLPLDPSLPQQRLEMILAEARPQLILTQQRVRDVLSSGDASVICLDADWSRVAGEPADNPNCAMSATSTAYVIYTSGSTGRPKGVVISHRAICNRLLWLQAEYPLTPQDTLLQKTVFNFDASVWEIFVPLLAGARIVLAEDGREHDVAYLVQAIAEHEVTILQLVPSMLALLLEEEGLEELHSLRRLFCGGEALPTALAKRFYNRFSADLVNLYGPTESSIDATHYACSRTALSALQTRVTVPIGKPLSNVSVYVTDEKLRPVPIGIAGELCIGGVGLAHGYLNRPDLTAEKFIPDPFSRERGARLYRTGDLARYASEGYIEFMGRLDHQVKIRGNRIELSEIEAVLTQHELVNAAVVIVRSDEPGEQRLVAYVVPQQADEKDRLSVSSLHRHLKDKLPDYMIPAAFVMLKALPLLPNGKVDRHALPKPEAVRPELEQEFVAPRTPVEELLAGIWSQVLNIESLGVNDNFFELGGHSLLVTQIVTRARAAFKIDLPLRSVFDHQTIAQLAETVEQALIEGKGEAEPPLTPMPRADHLALSFAQQRLWFLDQLNPGSTAYNIPRTFRFIGRLNVPVLEKTLSEIQRRHMVLRTIFALVEGQPVQVIQEPAPLTLPVTDLTNLPEAERETRAHQLATEEAERRFDLVHGPLWHTSVSQLGEEDFMVSFTMHHIVSDAWSMGVLVREVATLYQAFLHQQPSPLPELEIQYADYAHWQQELLQGEFLESQLSYWREQLADSVTLALPVDHPRPAVQTTNGTNEFFQLTPELTAALHALSRTEEVTLFMTLLAAFKALLHFYSDQTSISVGTPIAGRRHVETEKLVGFFVNTLVLRTDVAGDLSFRELLLRVREVALGAYSHQDMPFEMLVEQLRPERNLSHTPLFQVVFSMQNVPTEVLELPDLSWYPVASEVRTAKFDMTMNMTEQGGQFVGGLEYNTDLFDRSTIVTMLEHFQRLLELVTENPDAQLSSLSLLREDVRRDLLVDRNDTHAEYPRHLCIQQLFEAQAERAANEIAVVFGDEQLTYGELNSRANQLCRHLTSLGVGRDTRVGLFLEHSIETVTAILAVLKAGAAYVPLEPAHPAARLSFIVEDAALPVILTQSQIMTRLPQSNAQIVCLDTDWSDIARYAGDDPEKTSTPEDLAYVIYTSGSTGEPKGVKIRHRSLVNYIWWAKDAYLQGEQLDFPLYSSLAFDLTVTSIFTPLATGNKVLIYREQDAEASLSALLNDNRSGVVKLTPSHLMLLKQRDNRGSSIKRLIVGGEALTTELSLQVHESFGGKIEIYNEYGPTEATVGCMIYKYDAEHDRRAFVPIGRPAANVSLYVLDGNLQPVAENIPGDLYIAGDGLADGYLNRDGLTAEKFIDNPYQPDTKMYRSGDRAKWLPDGELEFLGRRDEQVKFHAYRIELGEIRSALNRHPLIRDSVVVISKTQRGDDVLVAYYVSRHEIAAMELRDFLLAVLIKETIPSVFVHLNKLPLTLNGKINYRALPTLEEAREQLKRDYVAPATPVEQALAEIWAEELGIERVGVTDNFFELGGHSLLIVRVNTKIRVLLHHDVSIVNMFEYPTVKALARYLSPDEAQPAPEPDAGSTRKDSFERQRQLRARRRSSRASAATPQ